MQAIIIFLAVKFLEITVRNVAKTRSYTKKTQFLNPSMPQPKRFTLTVIGKPFLVEVQTIPNFFVTLH